MEPFLFNPYFKNVIWGGDKICRYKGIPQPAPNIGESWEISAIPGHESVVAAGKHKGLTLTRLVELLGVELLGERVVERYGLRFPLLIKFIDARDNLSVQVHPDDDLALSRHNSFGKSELWYIIDTEPGAKIFSGLRTQMTPDEYAIRVADGSFADTLAVHDSAPGDVFFLPSGRVHAIGSGNFLAEIQQSSDVTYRIYDYDRRDAEGRPRELHTDLARDAIDFTVLPDYKSPRPSESEKDCELVSCEHFTTRRLIVDGCTELELTPGSFSVLICIDGQVEIQSTNVINNKKTSTPLPTGQSALIPAALPRVTLRGRATLLLTHV